MNLLRVGAFSILLSSCTTLEVTAQQPEQTPDLATINSITPQGNQRWIVTIRPNVIEAAMPPLEPINPVGSVQEKLSTKFQELRKQAISDFCFQKRSDFLVRGFYYKKLAENSFYVIGNNFAKTDLEIYDVRLATKQEEETYQFTITLKTKKNTYLREQFVGITYLAAIEKLKVVQQPMLTLYFKVIELDERIVNETLIVADPAKINLIIKNGVIIDALSDLEIMNGR